MENNQFNQQVNEQPNVQQSQSVPPPMPNSYLALAIFTTICCCLPLGIVGIIKGSKVSGLYAMRQYEAANLASSEAKKWCIYGIAIGLTINVIYGLLIVLGVIPSALNQSI